MSAVTPETFGPFLLLDRINVGGMAEVFRGKAQGVAGFERLVALKRILPSVSQDPDFIEMFVDEAKIAVQLQHANIAQTYDLGEVAGQYYIAMEYVSGVDVKTLWSRARQRKRLLPIPMSLHIVQKMCEGLDFAHRKADETGRKIGLVHRDVSPHNVLCSFDGEIKVIDFGIAKVQNKVSKTQAGALKGKFGYMSPEQVRGLEPDHRVDVFACGIVLYELLVGRRMFRGNSEFSILEKVRNVDFVPPTEINTQLDPDLAAIIMKALAKDKEDRWEWASDMAKAIQDHAYATGQLFQRADLVRYLSTHFAEEKEAERERLQRYRQLSVPGTQAESSPSPPQPAAPAAPAETAPAAFRLPEVARERVDATWTQTRSGEPKPPSEAPRVTVSALKPPVAQRPRLPIWAAMLLGALGVVAVLGVGSAIWLGQKASALEVQVRPNHADIYVDDRYLGSGEVSIEGLSQGSHILRVEAEGRETLVKTIELRPGQSRVEVLELPPAAGAPPPPKTESPP
ncbi:MAG: serine/threonine-protein kinase [Myxococcota bacterium]